MARDPRYDILFEPIKIGPVTARNRFYQVPHCNGMGYAHPIAHARMREIKAEGGWAVVCTEEASIHVTADISPFVEARVWDEHDNRALELMCEGVHRHGSLAGIELVHKGVACANRYTREVPLGPSHQPVNSYDPIQARAMDREDIRTLRRWHREAALRAKRAGFDIIYVYAGHDISLPMHFLQKRRNHRTDEYGGSLENRARLFRELIEDTKEAVGDSCGVVVRLAVDELMGPYGITSESEGREVVELLAELPDLWDVNVSSWYNDSTTSRFAKEGSQEPYIAFVKKLTTKPVVSVGRFTSPDTMVSQIKRGILDMIGAARPSIADPFLPKKIEEGRIEDIRECIGCNICVTGDFLITPYRCTQNPTQGEEWRKGWHPEIIQPRSGEGSVLVVGAGPAGLEAARALGARGYEVHLAEATTELGGRVTREAKLPGLAEWARVRDWRVGQIQKMPNVEIYRSSKMVAGEVREFGAAHVVVATGARWRKDGVGRASGYALAGFDGPDVFTPDDIMAGRLPSAGPVVVYDDDHYYMGGVIAERLRQAELEVALVTGADVASAWTHNTLEVDHIQKRLMQAGVELVAKKDVIAFRNGSVELVCVYSAATSTMPCRSLVTVTSRLPEDALYRELAADPEALRKAGIRTLKAIGDCWAPAAIVQAVYAGHRYARELDAPPSAASVPFRRELPREVAAP